MTAHQLAKNIANLLSHAPEQLSVPELFFQLIDQGLSHLPLPGSGQTLLRWHILSTIAQHDVSLAKCVESHTHALAVMTELGYLLAPKQSAWGVWCTEGPENVVTLTSSGDRLQSGDTVILQGCKQWCSGAPYLTHALISCHDQHGKRFITAVDLDQVGITITLANQAAVGMSNTAASDVTLAQVHGTIVGNDDDYLLRPGFWYRGAGVAACWYGALAGLSHYVFEAAKKQPSDYQLVHLAALDVYLSQCQSLLRDTASHIDQQPFKPNLIEIYRTRLAIENAIEHCLPRISRALGVEPLFTDNKLAKLMADLPVFLRQSRAEHDQECHATRLLEKNMEELWTL
jgi:alkylation response protein AidB-like acyl-CoA dehydrogenase